MEVAYGGCIVQEIHFVLGGARSGKSAYAERLIEATGLPKVYIATAQAFDAEMKARIVEHQSRRTGWQTVDAPLDLAEAITARHGKGQAVLVDCLTLWLTNLMMAEQGIAPAFEMILEALRLADHPVVLVSNEVGLGIVPENTMARAFRDHTGRLHQMIAAEAAHVHFIAAGLPIKLKG
jgi:adenosylcobinamide kinase / adenosylcobinamide-phosphate guanylyltransferase